MLGCIKDIESNMRILWHIYVFLLVLQLFIGAGFIILSLINGETNLRLTPFFYIYYIINIISVVGLNYFVINKPLVNYNFWLVIGIAFFMASLLESIGVVNLVQTANASEIDVFGAVNLWFYVPLFYGLFKYSKRSHVVWQNIST